MIILCQIIKQLMLCLFTYKTEAFSPQTIPQNLDSSGIFGIVLVLPYLFGFKMEVYSFLHSLKNLGPSYKMDLDLRDCIGRVILVL